MKKIIYTFVFLLLANFSLAAMTGDSGSKDSSSNQENLYKAAKKLVIKAKKLEKKDKLEKALKLYKGNISIFGRKSKKSIYSEKKSSFESGRIFSKEYVKNFIKISAKKLRK